MSIRLSWSNNNITTKLYNTIKNDIEFEQRKCLSHHYYTYRYKSKTP